MSKKSFWDHPIATIEEALHIRKQIDVLQARLNKLVGGAVTVITPLKLKGKKISSPQTRERMGAGQRARRAKVKGRSAAATQKVAAAKPAASKPKAIPKKKGGITPEGRARLAAAMKARWAAKKAQ